MAKAGDVMSAANSKDNAVSPVATVDELVNALCSDDSRLRQEARGYLARMGGAAVPTLVAALASPDAGLRWEAAMTLREIDDPRAAPAFVRALEDDSSDVRWIAAEGLIALGQDSLAPLLRALMQRPPSPWLYEGAHHVLDALDTPGLLPATVKPVLSALEGLEPALTVPTAAQNALWELASMPAPVNAGESPR